MFFHTYILFFYTFNRYSILGFVIRHVVKRAVFCFCKMLYYNV